MESFSCSGGSHHGHAAWEWWMLVVIGFAGTAVVVSVILAVLCLVWRCCYCCSSHRIDHSSPSPYAAKDLAEPQRSTDARASSFCRRPSINDDGDGEAAVAAPTAETSSTDLGYSLLNMSTPRDRTGVAEKEAATNIDQPPKPSPSPVLNDAHADPSMPLLVTTSEICANPFQSELTTKAPNPEDIFVAVTCCESPEKRMRRHRSIASHMGEGLSHDESVRLHLMRHADTSDPTFGVFLRSSRNKH